MDVCVCCRLSRKEVGFASRLRIVVVASRLSATAARDSSRTHACVPSEVELLIHYNGWPTRWDEWIVNSSARIAPFRTRTVHPAHAPFVSPSPNTAVATAPRTADDDDVRVLLPALRALVGGGVEPRLVRLGMTWHIRISPLNH